MWKKFTVDIPVLVCICADKKQQSAAQRVILKYKCFPIIRQYGKLLIKKSANHVRDCYQKRFFVFA